MAFQESHSIGDVHMNGITRVSAPVRIDISPCWPDSGRYRKEFGGFLLNGAINKRVATIIEDGRFITSMEGVPPNSGLGTSAAVRATFLVASNPVLLDQCSLGDLIRKVFVFENEVLEQTAGVQDQAAAFAGGVNLWEFTASDAVRRNEIPQTAVAHFQERTVLIYTGETHQSSDMHHQVFDSQGYDRQIPLFDEMSQLAKEMAYNINNEDRMSELMREARRLHQEPYAGIETNTMRSISKMLDGTYSAWKATGAGGGGCMIFYTATPADLSLKFEREKAVGNLPADSCVLPFKFDVDGLKIHRS
jgi:galactokinase/mevalonate kinase-like predicted kinase